MRNHIDLLLTYTTKYRWRFGSDTSAFRDLLSSHASTLETLSLTLDVIRDRIPDENTLQPYLEAELGAQHLLPQFINLRSLTLRSIRWSGSWRPMRACLQANQMRLERLVLVPTYSLDSPSVYRPPRSTVYTLREIFGDDDGADNVSNDENGRSSRQESKPKLKPEPALSFPRLESLELGSIDLTPWRPRSTENPDLAPNPNLNLNPPSSTSSSQAGAASTTTAPALQHPFAIFNMAHLTSLAVFDCINLDSTFSALGAHHTSLKLRTLDINFGRFTLGGRRTPFVRPNTHYPHLAAAIAVMVRNAAETLERFSLGLWGQMIRMGPFLDQVWEALGSCGDGDGDGGLRELVWHEPLAAWAANQTGTNNDGIAAPTPNPTPTPPLGIHASTNTIAETLKASRQKLEFLGISDTPKRAVSLQ